MTSFLLRHSSKIVLAAAVCASFIISSYQLSVATYVMIFSIVCIGLVLMTGIGGMMSFGQAAFVGLGAYITGYLSSTCALSPWIGLAAALAGALLVATLIGSVTVRMSGHYLALVTLCFCISFYFLAGNTEALGRFNGMTGIPPISLGGYELRSERSNYLIVLAALAARGVVDQAHPGFPCRTRAALAARRPGYRRDLRRERLSSPVAGLRDSGGVRGLLGLALCAHPAVREPDALRRSHEHRVPVHDGDRGQRAGLGRDTRRRPRHLGQAGIAKSVASDFRSDHAP